MAAEDPVAPVASLPPAPSPEQYPEPTEWIKAWAAYWRQVQPMLATLGTVDEENIEE